MKKVFPKTGVDLKSASLKFFFIISLIFKYFWIFSLVFGFSSLQVLQVHTFACTYADDKNLSFVTLTYICIHKKEEILADFLGHCSRGYKKKKKYIVSFTVKITRMGNPN